MSVERLTNRRMTLLKRLSEAAQFRHDIAIALLDCAPMIDREDFCGGARFVDKENAMFEGGSDSAYDFNKLSTEGLIEHFYLDYDSNGLIANHTRPGLKVTREGLAAVAEANKGWLQKAIEKQPITFIQVIGTTAMAILSFIAGLLVGSSR